MHHEKAHYQKLETIYNRRINNQDTDEVSEDDFEVQNGFDAVFFTNGKSRKWTSPTFDPSVYNSKKFAVRTNKVVVVTVPKPKRKRPSQKGQTVMNKTRNSESDYSSSFKLEKVYPEEIGQDETDNTVGEPGFFVANTVPIFGIAENSMILTQQTSKKPKLSYS